MFKWTTFEDLSKALRKMGVDSRRVKPVDIPVAGRNLDDFVLTSGGLYRFEPTKKDGTRIVRQTLNMCDNKIKWIEKNYAGDVEKIFREKKFDDIDFLEAVHRYHFTYCRTIEEWRDKKRSDRFYASDRWTGKFLYAYLEDNKEKYRNKNQKLYPCKNCLKNLSERTGRKYNHKKFDIGDSLNVEPLHVSVRKECDYIPNVYSSDWLAISKHLKEEKNYTCEDCRKKPKQRKDIHCHHKNHLKHDNRSINLEVLCKSCHVKRHPHMQVD